jgi:hypothetical protein
MTEYKKPKVDFLFLPKMLLCNDFREADNFRNIFAEKEKFRE